MIAAIGARLDRVFRRVTPEPFVLAIGLTVFVLAVGVLYSGGRVVPVLDAWQGPRGFWSLLAFGMQMCLVLVTGFALATSRPVRAMLERLARLPRTGAQAAALVAGVSVAASLLNWGLCLVAGALLARAVGRSCAHRGIRAHYPLLAAAGYSGMMTWHGGFSGSAPLKVTTQKDLVELLGPELGAAIEPVVTADTLLSQLNLTTSLGALVWVPLVVFLLHPRAEVREYTGPVEVDETPSDERGLQHHPVVMLGLAVPLAAAVLLYLSRYGVARLDPNAINLMLLTLGLVAHGSATRYVRAVTDAAQSCAGIILQFPLYAGIMGIMAGTGLASALARAAVATSGADTYLVLTFLGAGIVNLFVPSGGGQWAVQGPIAIEAARALDLSLGSVVMAVAYGDQWTNMLQPFWALPLLGITGVKAGEILGYTVVLLGLGGVWFTACLVLLG